MTNVDEDRDRKDVLSDEEFNLMLTQARGNDDEFLAHRDPAILCMLRLTGKRREEVAGLAFNDVWIEGDYIHINFVLLKKHQDKPPERVRSIPLDDPLTKPILDYMKYLKRKYKEMPKSFWPRVRPHFGHNVVYLDKGISGRAVYNVVRKYADAAGVVAWPHLFRETAGAEEVKQDPSLYGVYKVANRIDVTEQTAWNYMRRHAMNVIRREYKNGGVK